MITFLLVQCIRPGKYLIPTSQVRRLKHRGTYGLRKAVHLAFNPSSHSGVGGGRRIKTVAPLSIVSLFPAKGSTVRQVTPGLLYVALEIISFASPPLSLPYLIPSHWYQLAVPHIRGRMWPSQ